MYLLFTFLRPMLLQLQNDDSLKNLRDNVMWDKGNVVQNITLMDASEKKKHFGNCC